MDAVKHLGIDANLGDPRPLGPLLVAILEFLADSPQEDVQGGVGGHFVERLLGVVSTEEEVDLQVSNHAVRVLRFVDMHIRP